MRDELTLRMCGYKLVHSLCALCVSMRWDLSFRISAIPAQVGPSNDAAFGHVDEMNRQHKLNIYKWITLLIESDGWLRPSEFRNNSDKFNFCLVKSIHERRIRRKLIRPALENSPFLRTNVLKTSNLTALLYQNSPTSFTVYFSKGFSLPFIILFYFKFVLHRKKSVELTCDSYFNIKWFREKGKITERISKSKEEKEENGRKSETETETETEREKRKLIKCLLTVDYILFIVMHALLFLGMSSLGVTG